MNLWLKAAELKKKIRVSGNIGQSDGVLQETTATKYMAKTFTLSQSDLSVKPDEVMNYVEEDFRFEPSQGVVDAILRYSQSLEVRKSKMVGVVETVSN